MVKETVIVIGAGADWQAQSSFLYADPTVFTMR